MDGRMRGIGKDRGFRRGSGVLDGREYIDGGPCATIVERQAESERAVGYVKRCPSQRDRGSSTGKGTCAAWAMTEDEGKYDVPHGVDSREMIPIVLSMTVLHLPPKADNNTSRRNGSARIWGHTPTLHY